MRNTFLRFYRIREREAAVAEDDIPDWGSPMFHDAPEYDGKATEALIDLERAIRKRNHQIRHMRKIP